MEKWLSFIVPIYNAEKYLIECVDSLLNQNFPKELYEVILYDDGSTDNSFKIAKEYAEKHSNVRAFTHSNCGVSLTRNAGISESVGEYIWFVDNDDYIVKDILPVLHEWTSTENVDMLIFDALNFNENKVWKLWYFTVKETPVITGQDAFMGFYYNTVPWTKLYRRAFIEKYHLYFVQWISEDSELLSRCFYHAERVKAIPVDAIYYRILPSSLSHAKANQKVVVEGLLECLENHYVYMLDHRGDRFWMRAFVLDLRRLHNVGLDRIECTPQERKAYIEREKNILKKIVKHLPISLCLDYIILRICAISPTFILNLQAVMRRMKRLKHKIIKRV